MISILVLTKNEQQDLPGCLESISWCDEITQRKFDNWAAHQNWGLANIAFKYPWVLYIDADERVSPDLKNALYSIDTTKEAVAFEIRRRDFAWNGTWLKHAQISPFYLRFFRPEKMKYERLVNPISIPDGPIARLDGYLDHYPFSKGVRYWLQRHLGYADMEAAMRLSDMGKGTSFSFRKALFSRDFTEKRFHQKGLFYKLPGRPIIKWFYMVIWRRAFLDGGAGITYATLQSIYEYFIVLRTKELVDEIKKAKKRV
jgi:glycosyltransferase involved in cell wall biosynthesis